MSSSLPRHSRAKSDLATARAVRSAWGLVAVLATSWFPLTSVEAASLVPSTWPAAGILAGLLLTSTRIWRRRLVLASFVLMLVVHLVQGYPLLVGLGFSLTYVAAAWVVRQTLVHGLGGRNVALLDQGDVSRMIRAITAGSLVAAAGCGATAQLTGHGSPALGALAAFAAHAASLLVLLPLFMETLHFKPLAGRKERAALLVLTVGTTMLVFLFADAPPVVFAVMPMFAWHAFRGTMREATLLLTLVGVIGTGLTLRDIGPIWGLGARYGLEPELVSGVLQLFLLDCGLILLPLSVMVTQQRMAATRADAERETLERLVASATGTAVIATDRHGRIVLFNPGAEAMLGIAAKDALGDLPDRFYPRAELERHAGELGAFPDFADICRVSAVIGDHSRLWQFHRPSGEIRTMRMTLTAVPDGHGVLSGYLATAEDVTERESAHRALLTTLEHERTAMERLQELERVKGDFVASISHELRTPITNIVGYTELLEDGAVGELSFSQREVVGRVDRNGRRLLQLVEDLLRLSQIESSRMTIEPVTTDLRWVVVNAREALAPLLSGRLLKVSVAVPECPIVQHVDPVQLERAVLMLLTNAVKFTPDGGSVRLELCDGPDQCEIVVTDTGVGIPEAEQAELFTRFHRSSTASTQAVQGTGLGLTIVRAIVALHGGEVRLDSAHEEGTKVSVTLPHAAVALGVA